MRSIVVGPAGPRLPSNFVVASDSRPPFNPHHARAKNEALSCVLIDKAPEFSGWHLLDPHQVRFEINDSTFNI